MKKTPRFEFDSVTSRARAIEVAWLRERAYLTHPDRPRLKLEKRLRRTLSESEYAAMVADVLIAAGWPADSAMANVRANRQALSTFRDHGFSPKAVAKSVVYQLS